MSKLDLTHGGFYRHFGSKEQLVVEAIVKALEEAASHFVEAAEKAPPGSALKLMIERYLSLAHCENPAEGCPIAALITEIAHYPRPVRTKLDRALKDHVNKMSRFLPGASETERRLNCMVLFSGMSGALNVARATADAQMRKTILESAKEFYIKAFCQ
jgi:TetR/AcrR family transcriptional repressor of nem operon